MSNEEQPLWFDVEIVDGELSQDSTNHGWGFELAALRREDELRISTMAASCAVADLTMAWLSDDRSWDFFEQNEPPDPDVYEDEERHEESVWWQMATELDKRFTTFPEYITALITTAVLELAEKAVVPIKAISGIEKEMRHTRKMCRSNPEEVKDELNQRVDELFALKVQEYHETGEEVNDMDTQTLEKTGMSRFKHGTPEHRAAYAVEYDNATVRMGELQEEILNLTKWMDHLETMGDEYDLITHENEEIADSIG